MPSKFSAKFNGTRVAKLVLLNRFYSSFVGKVISAAFWLMGAGAVFIWISWMFDPLSVNVNYGLDQIFLALFMIFLAIRSFLRYYVQNPAIITPANLAKITTVGAEANFCSAFSVGLSRALITLGNDLEELNSGDVLRAIVSSAESSFIFNRLGRAKEEIIQIIDKEKSASAVRFSVLAERALDVAIAENRHQIETGDMLVALAEADVLFSSYLSKLDISAEDLAHVVYWQTTIQKKIDDSHRHLDPEYLHLSGGIGKDWAYGYTPDLDHYSSDVTESLSRQGLGIELIGHDKVINRIEQSLNRNTGANAILVGEPGIGKRTTLLGFAKKIDEGRSLPNLSHRHVIELNVDLLISGLSGPGEFTQRITQVLSQAANAGNLIIFIDGIEKILSSGEAGKIDATSVIMPYLNYPEINFVGTTNTSDFDNLIAGNPALMQKFEKIDVVEPSESEMIRILEDDAPRIESHFDVLVTYSAIKEVVKLAGKYILDQPNPEKSISILDGAANTLTSSKNKILTAKVVDDYVSTKANVPVENAEGREKEVLINLEEEMKKKIIGQVQAVKAVTGALKRSRAGVTDSKKPIGSFLFLGPTGVGKTETAKALAELYFGSKDAMVRFDMSEYQNKEDVYRLIGSPAGHGERVEGELISQVRSKPFSLILFDEIEKANPDILNLFLQVLDEGFITSSAGRKVFFKNSIIIATSNAGANLIRQIASKNLPYDQAKKEVVSYVQNQGTFRPEFINRFTEVVYYLPLTKVEIKEVAKLMIRKLATDIGNSKGFSLKVEISALEKLAELGYDPEMGARPMARVIEEQVENSLAEKILKGEAVKGSEVVFKLSDIK